MWSILKWLHLAKALYKKLDLVVHTNDPSPGIWRQGDQLRNPCEDDLWYIWFCASTPLKRGKVLYKQHVYIDTGMHTKRHTCEYVFMHIYAHVFIYVYIKVTWSMSSYLVTWVCCLFFRNYNTVLTMWILKIYL